MEQETGQKQQKPQIWDEDCYQRRIAGIHAKRPSNAVSSWTYLQTVAKDYRAWLDRADGDTTEVAGDRYWEVCEHTVIAWTEAIETPQFLTVNQRAHICQNILESMASDYTVPAYTPDDIYTLYKAVIDYERTVLALTEWIRSGKALLDFLQTVCMENDGTEVQATMLRLDGLDWGPSDERILENARMGMDIGE